jgi:hypothetical protein
MFNSKLRTVLAASDGRAGNQGARFHEMNCPECGKPLRPIWYGLLACFCRWGGKRPTVDQIVKSADEYERQARKLKRDDRHREIA